MVPQVLDLRRTWARDHHTTNYDSTFLMGSKEGLVFDALAAIVCLPNSYKSLSISDHMPEGSHTIARPVPQTLSPLLHTTKLNRPPAGNRWALNLGCAKWVSSVGVARESVGMEWRCVQGGDLGVCCGRVTLGGKSRGLPKSSVEKYLLQISQSNDSSPPLADTPPPHATLSSELATFAFSISCLHMHIEKDRGRTWHPSSTSSKAKVCVWLWLNVEKLYTIRTVA